MKQDFFTIEEMATILRVRVSAIRARLGRNDPALPPSRRVGGRRLFPTALYLEWREALLRTEELSASNEVTFSASIECRADGQSRLNDEVSESPAHGSGQAGTAGILDDTIEKSRSKRARRMRMA